MRRVRFTEAARRATLVAQAEAGERGGNRLLPAHLLYALLVTAPISATGLLARLEIAVESLRDALLPHLQGAGFVAEQGIRPSEAFRRVNDRAHAAMRDLGDRALDSRHLLLGIAAESEGTAARLLADHGASYEVLRAACESRGRLAAIRRWFGGRRS